jgi:hypothetical protein
VAELSRREDEILALIRAADRKYNWGIHAHSVSHGPAVIYPAKKKPISEAAAELLGGYTPEPAQEDTKPRLEYTSAFSREAAPLAAELGAIREALAVLCPKLRDARQEASRRYCEALLSKYRPIMGDLCQAAVTFGSAILVHRDFVQAIQSQGCDWAYLQPGDVVSLERAFGEPTQRYSLLRRFLSSAIEGGHVPPSAVPGAWHHPPQVAPIESSAPASPIDAPLPAVPAEPPLPAAVKPRVRRGILARLADATKSASDDGGAEIAL